MKVVVLISRILLGFMFAMAGLDGVLRFATGNGLFPEPAPSPAMMAVMPGLMGLKYLFPLAKLIELIAGILLLCNRYVNLAIIILTPVMVNILGINTFVDATGAPIAIGLSILLLIVIWSRWSHFRPVVTAKTWGDMDESDFEGTLVLEKLSEIGKVDEFLDAVDDDDFKTAATLMRRAKIDPESIEMVLQKMAQADGEA